MTNDNVDVFDVDVDLHGPARCVVLITGVPGAGKSSVAAEVASQLPRSALISGDAVGHLVIGGKATPQPSDGHDWDPEPNAQILLRSRNAAALARSFVAAGFVPVIEDVVVRRTHLLRYLAELDGLNVLHFVLAPAPAKVAEWVRARGRPADHDWSELDDVMRNEISTFGRWIDSTEHTRDETVERIVAYLTERAGSI